MKKKLTGLVSSIAVALACTSCKTTTVVENPEAFVNQGEINVIPRPASFKKIEAAPFVLNDDTEILTFGNTDKASTYLADKVLAATGWELDIDEIDEAPEADETNFIMLGVNENLNYNDEGYKLTVLKRGITLIAKTEKGLFWGVQSLLQLMPNGIVRPVAENANVVWEVPAVLISDKPTFAYRGMMLDVSRHVFSVADVKKYIDYLAMNKINTFHWHLVDDQGWRIEIKKYPKLTEIGAFRGPANNQYGGFYTQENIKEIVAYAAERCITVIPEIEMPGHSVAAIASYSALSCSGKPAQVRTAWGISENVYCAGNEEVFTFIENVLTEVMALFPSKYIHIGGDECPKKAWKKCPKCQAKIKAEGLKNEHELQSYFIKRVEKFLQANDRELIGWDEITEGGLSPTATMMYWRSWGKGVVEAATKAGNKVIMTPNSTFYFDHYQQKGCTRAKPGTEPKAIGGFSDLSKVYNYDLIPAGLAPEQAKLIIGGQANLWTEYIPTFAQAEYMVLPRMFALSETLWTPKVKKDFAGFKTRLGSQSQRLQFMGVNARFKDEFVTPVVEQTVEVPEAEEAPATEAK